MIGVISRCLHKPLFIDLHQYPPQLLTTGSMQGQVEYKDLASLKRGQIALL